MQYRLPIGSGIIFTMIILSVYLHPFIWIPLFVLFMTCVIKFYREEAIRRMELGLLHKITPWPLTSIDVWSIYKGRIITGGVYLLLLIGIHMIIPFRNIFHVASYLLGGYVGFDLLAGPFLINEVLISSQLSSEGRRWHLIASLTGVIVGTLIMFLAQSAFCSGIVGLALVPLSIFVIECVRRLGQRAKIEVTNFVFDMRRAFYISLILNALIIPLPGSLEALKALRLYY